MARPSFRRGPQVRVTIDVQAEVNKAVKVILDRIDTQNRAWRGENYFSASDVVQRIRCACAERVDEVPVGSYNHDFCKSGALTILTGAGGRSSLLQEVRYALGRVRGLEVYSPTGRHTSTGLRFRKIGAGLTEAECKTQETRQAKKDRGPIRHYARTGVNVWDLGTPLCKPVQKRVSYRYSGRRIVHETDEVTKVTCKRCLSLLAKRAGFSKDALPEAIQDKLMEEGKLPIPVVVE